MKFRFFICATLLAFCSGCAVPAKKTTAEVPGGEGARETASTITPENAASFYQQISFGHNSAALSASDKDKLDLMIQKARKAGKIDDIKVVAWADGEYPAKRSDKMPPNERHLADARARSVLIFLKDQIQGIRSQQYNMAERPNILQELLATPDARMKTSLETAGLATTNHDLRYPENASTALVLVIMKQ